MATNYGLRGAAVLATVAAVSIAAFTLPANAGRDWDDWDEGVVFLPDAPTWRKECGSCHVPYSPNLLPKASWRKIMGGLDQHFGENAALDPETTARILALLEAHAADGGYSRYGAEVMEHAYAGEAPLRITETAWFRDEHDDVPRAAWKRAAVGSPANCAACHKDAERGVFDEHAVRIPR